MSIPRVSQVSPLDEVDVELHGEAVDGEVLPVQAHMGEEVQLVPACQ